MEGFINNIRKVQAGTGKTQEQVSKLREKFFAETTNVKTGVSELFAQLRMALDKKEKEVMKNVDDILSENVSEVDMAMKMVSEKSKRTSTVLNQVT